MCSTAHTRVAKRTRFSTLQMTFLLLALLEKKTEHYIKQQPEAVNETEFALISLIKIMSMDNDTGLQIQCNVVCETT